MHSELLRALSAVTTEEQAILSGVPEIDPAIYTRRSELVVEKDRLLAHGKLISVRPHTRFVRFPKHRHDYVEVVYMCSGSTTHIIDGEKVVLKEGDLLFLNQNSEQEIWPAGMEDIAVNFIILPQFFDTAFAMLGGEANPLREFLLGTMTKSGANASYLYFHVADILPIQNLIENMIWTIFYNMPSKRKSNQITMGLLMLNLLNHMDKMERGSDSSVRELVGVVYGYVEEHYRDGSLEDLARETGYSVYWLSREIRKRTGRTYQELMLAKRMDQAAYLLRGTRLPVSDIIRSVGYSNSSYFYRVFKTRYKMSPKAYRAGKE